VVSRRSLRANTTIFPSKLSYMQGGIDDVRETAEKMRQSKRHAHPM